MTIDELIKEFGGLLGSIKFFGWQGGTIHQVREAWLIRLSELGYMVRKDGVICTLVIN